MKLSTVRRFSMAMSGAFVACLAFAAHGSTNVFDDAVFWFRGGKDMNGDGYMQQGEFFDDLHANDTDHSNHQMSMTGFSQNAEFRTEAVVFPALGNNVVQNMQVLHIDNVRGTVDGQLKYHPLAVNPHTLFSANNISNEYTIVSRIRLDNLDRMESLFRIGYDSSTKKGMMLGLATHDTATKCKYITGFCTAREGSGNKQFHFKDLMVPTNTWVDVAVVVGNGNLRVGVAVPTSLSSPNDNPTIAFAETPMWTGNCPVLDAAYYKLFHLNGQDDPAVAGSVVKYFFVGSVQQLAIWKRALTDQEVMAAFGMPRPAILRIGFDNGSSGEFGGTRSGSSQEIDGLGSWQNIANTMLAGDTWTVNFTALRDEASLPQIFSIKSLRGSPAQIEPKLNGTSLGEGRVGSSARFFWPVPADLINEGANTLVLERKDGWAGTFKLDAMELGGSLGVGTISGSSTDDGRTDPEYTKTGVPSAADPNPQHWPQELQPYSDSGITNLHLRVWVDPDVVDKASFTFKTTVQGVSSPGKTKTDKEYFTVFVNNRPIISCTTKVSASGLTWTRAFDAENLHGGWNDFEFICPEPYETCHWLFDYFRFETTLPSAFGFPPPPGMSVIVK